MNYRYQVVVYDKYYPSSSLFETKEEALAYFSQFTPSFAQSLMTLCEIIDHKNQLGNEKPEILW